MFFLQAEDGIRDIGVTGVQTCALPICAVDAQLRRGRAAAALARYLAHRLEEDVDALVGAELPEEREAVAPAPLVDRKSVVQGKSADLGGRRIIKKKHSHPTSLQLSTLH